MTLSLTSSYNNFNYASAYSSGGNSSAYASSNGGYSQAYASSGSGFSQAYASSGCDLISGGYRPVTPGIHRMGESNCGFLGKSTSVMDELGMMSGFGESSDQKGDMMKKAGIGMALAMNPAMGLADLLSGGKLSKKMMENGPAKMGDKIKDKMKSDIKNFGEKMKEGGSKMLEGLKKAGETIGKIFSKL